MMKTLVVANQKGGVGKTALVVHLAFDFAERGLRVLVLDLDTQGNTSYSLEKQTTVGDASHLFGAAGPRLQGAAGIQVFRADPALADFDAKNVGDAASCFRDNLQRLEGGFDVCLIDTAPGMGVRLIAALIAADYVLSPIELESYSLLGIRMMVTTIGNVRRSNPALKFLGILPSKVDGRNPRHLAHLAELSAAYQAQLIPTPIGLRSSVADALATGQPVWAIRKTAARKAAGEMRAVAAHLFQAMNLTDATAGGTRP